MPCPRGAGFRRPSGDDAAMEPFHPQPVLLLGPGPSPVAHRVLAAMGAPVLGHLDPEFLALMDGVQGALRELFGVDHRFTLPVSGTGSAGMECCIVNLVEPGDRVVVGVHGVFGERMCEVVRRQGGEPVAVRAEYGAAVDPGAMAEAIAAGPTNVVGIVHAETSTGVLQPLGDIARAARDAGALFVVDCVTSLAGMPLDLGALGVDAAYSGTQKCLSVPPGLAPVTFSERALERIRARERPSPSWYLDVALLDGYWGGGGQRAYHHTAPISMVYALAEGLRVVQEEGLVERAERHLAMARRLYDGLAALGLECAVEADLRTPMLTSVRIPEGVQDGAVRQVLRQRHRIEIGGGLGPLAGRVWRIGLMGHGARPESVARVLLGLADALAAQGRRVNGATALDAAGV